MPTIHIHIPGPDEVTFRHPSLHDFFTTKSRSGPFFLPPSYHLELSYRCFTLQFEHSLEIKDWSLAVEYASRHFRYHLTRFLEAVGEQKTLLVVEQFTRPFSQTLPYPYFFAFALLSWETMRGSHHIPSEHASRALIKCLANLGLALRSDPVPARWLDRTFYSLGFWGDFIPETLIFEVRQEQATMLHCILQRVEAEIRAKVCS
jgi:hypothetical protein